MIHDKPVQVVVFDLLVRLTPLLDLVFYFPTHDTVVAMLQAKVSQ